MPESTDLKLPQLKVNDDETKRAIDAALQEQEEATAAGIVYLPHIFAACSIPHKEPFINVIGKDGTIKRQPKSEFSTTNGIATLSIHTSVDITGGLPFGMTPRLEILYITTQAQLKQSRMIDLGDNITEHLRQLGLNTSGVSKKRSKESPTSRFQKQMLRLFGATISYKEEIKGGLSLKNIPLADSLEFWSPADPTEKWFGALQLSEQFYSSIMNHSVPLPVSAIQYIGKSPLAFDLYVWLVWRMSFLRKEQLVPYGWIKKQVGTQNTSMDSFKQDVGEAIATVRTIYPSLAVAVMKEGLMLRPSPTPIPKKLSKLRIKS